MKWIPTYSLKRSNTSIRKIYKTINIKHMVVINENMFTKIKNVDEYKISFTSGTSQKLK